MLGGLLAPPFFVNEDRNAAHFVHSFSVRLFVE